MNEIEETMEQFDSDKRPEEEQKKIDKDHLNRYQPPNQEEGAAFDTLYLPIVHERNKTGFEENKDFPIMIDSVIAGRYQVQEYLGSAAFSRAVQCVDLTNNQLVCIKIIKNNKDFFDQSLDEIKLLRYINSNGDPDRYHVVQLYGKFSISCGQVTDISPDFFYFKEHLFLVCELLRDNLYEFCKYNRENEEELFFTIPRLQRITKQVLEGLSYIHSLGLIHCGMFEQFSPSILTSFLCRSET